MAFVFNNEKELKELIEEFYLSTISIDKSRIQSIFEKESGGSDLIINELKRINYGRI